MVSEIPPYLPLEKGGKGGIFWRSRVKCNFPKMRHRICETTHLGFAKQRGELQKGIEEDWLRGARANPPYPPEGEFFLRISSKDFNRAIELTLNFPKPILTVEPQAAGGHLRI